jgi:hypothetical protein
MSAFHRTSFKWITHLNEFLTPRIAGVQLNWRKSFEFSAKMGAGRFPNTRRSGDEDSSEDIRSILAGLLEA